jgi:conjugal transfer pilus assembly protein TraW
MKRSLLFLLVSLWGATLVAQAQGIELSVAYRPEAVAGVRAATEHRSYLLGMTQSLDNQSINPLMTTTLNSSLLFFNGDSLAQQEWAREKLAQNPNSVLILVQGAPFELSQQWQVPVYFDQGGELVSKLGIRHLPALVTQEGPQLRITEEVAL